MPSIIFLCGMPGSGKSTIAKKLAKQLLWKCLDLDIVIEENSGQSPNKWIREKGEAAFRKAESETLQSLIFSENTIVAVGGGTPCFNNNLLWMQQNGECIYLDIPLKALWTRVSKRIDKRPLLGSEIEALQNLTELYEKRKPIYAQIDWKEAGLTLDIKLLAEKIRASFY